MHEFNLETSTDELFSNLSRHCLLNCPRVALLLAQRNQIVEYQNEIANFTMGDDLENTMRQIEELLKQNNFPGELDIEECAKQSRINAGEAIELLDGLVNFTDQEINNTGQECDGPLEVTGIDCSGRNIGAFICRSFEAPDGDSFEPAKVFRY